MYQISEELGNMIEEFKFTKYGKECVYTSITSTYSTSPRLIIHVNSVLHPFHWYFNTSYYQG